MKEALRCRATVGDVCNACGTFGASTCPRRVLMGPVRPAPTARSRTHRPVAVARSVLTNLRRGCPHAPCLAPALGHGSQARTVFLGARLTGGRTPGRARRAGTPPCPGARGPLGRPRCGVGAMVWKSWSWIQPSGRDEWGRGRLGWRFPWRSRWRGGWRVRSTMRRERASRRAERVVRHGPFRGRGRSGHRGGARRGGGQDRGGGRDTGRAVGDHPDQALVGYLARVEDQSSLEGKYV